MSTAMLAECMYGKTCYQTNQRRHNQDEIKRIPSAKVSSKRY